MDKTAAARPFPEHARKVFSGEIFDVYQWKQEMYDGSFKTFERLKRPDTAVVIPVTEDGQIILTEQEQPDKAPFFSFAGGRVEPDEDAETAAHRELLEETGYECQEIVLIDARQPVSKIEWTVHTFVARGCRKVAEQNLDSGEKITLQPVSFDEFLDIALEKNFGDPELMRQILEAHYDPEKKAAFRKLLLGR